MVDLPKGEDVKALCLGQGWAAVATSALMLRLFSIGGVQREMFSLPGSVVCMAGHGEQLLIVYHRGWTQNKTLRRFDDFVKISSDHTIALNK